MLRDHRLGCPRHARRGAHLGLVQIPDRLDVRRRVAEPREVAEVVFAAVLGPDHQRVQLLRQVVDRDHATRALALPNRSGLSCTVGRTSATPSSIGSIDAVRRFAGGQPGRAAGLRVVEVDLLGMPRGPDRGHVLGPQRSAAIASATPNRCLPTGRLTLGFGPRPDHRPQRPCLLLQQRCQFALPRIRCTRSSVPPAARISASARTIARLGIDGCHRIRQHGRLEAFAIASRAVARTQ